MEVSRRGVAVWVQLFNLKLAIFINFKIINLLSERLMKDLLSIDLVQDVLIEPDREKETFNWLMCISKQKEH